MKLYRHYKNKDYKFIGIAKHSETLEDLVIYETRYDNPNGKIWVRPKEMFFETVDVAGKLKPRFEKISLSLRSTNEVSEAEIKQIAMVMRHAFGEWDQKWFHATFQNHKKFHLILACADERTVGFKLGYELNDREFYSWLGGVIPEYRGLQIASSLMSAQHHWCRQQGYTRIQTKTQNRFREMLLLNLRHGFDVIGIQDSDEGGMKIVLEKKLTGPTEVRTIK